MKTLIIAEAGVNHNGDINLAKKLIVAAASAGADLVKFQTFSAKNLVLTSAPKAEYQKNTTPGSESQFEMIQKLELSRDDHKVLIDECNRVGIGFLSTAFDLESFDLLTELGCIENIKIASGEITNLPLLRYMSRLNKPVYLSTGMATLQEIEAAIEAIEKAGTQRNLITVLHCTTEYPAPMEDINLNAILSMKSLFGLQVGYSDHTLGIEVPIAAVALGASVIEKHFTLNRDMPGPDHKASLEPDELSAMIKSIRNIEIALGDGVKKPSLNELKNKLIVRKSIVASREIKLGELFTEKNITTKRPGTGLSPMYWDQLIGKLAERNYLTDEMIEK
jgi:N,N'-diacetyllegionaminate synthase